MTEALIEALVEMREAEALAQANELLKGGTDPEFILQACSTAMEAVGQRFEKGEYFLPHLMMAGEMMQQISGAIKPSTSEKNQEKGKAMSRGRVLMGTVEGDIHDIGKDMVTFLLEANGFEVRDIGVDQSPAKFVENIQDFKPAIVGMSGLLTLAFDAMKATVQAITEAGFRDQVRIMIGGAQVTDQIRTYTGADAFGADAFAGVKLAKAWITG
ncbi:MAG: cobalamin-dependent protein [Desulfobacterales bacterium]